MWAVVALIGAGFATLAIVVQPGDGARELPAEFATEPDVYIEEGDVMQFRADGSLHYRLRAGRASYFESKAITQLDAPQLELHDASATPPWRLTAHTGEVRTVSTSASILAGATALQGETARDTEGDTEGTEEEFTLRGAVRLRQDRDDGFTEVSTEQLVLYPSRQFARADQPVMIATPASSATAASLDADLRSGRMRLFSSTHQRVSIVVEPLSRRP